MKRSLLYAAAALALLAGVAVAATNYPVTTYTNVGNWTNGIYSTTAGKLEIYKSSSAALTLDASAITTNKTLTFASDGRMSQAAITLSNALTAAGDTINAATTVNNATAAAEGIDLSLTQLTTARTSGTMSGVKVGLTSLAGDSGGVYNDLELNLTDGGGSATHNGVKFGAGFDALFDASASSTGQNDVVIPDNVAEAWTFREATNPYLTFVTTNSAESLASSVRLTTTDGVSSGTARVVGGLAYSSTAASTAITGATETEANFDTNYAMPANTAKAGTVIDVDFQGIHTATTGAETHDILVKVGTTTVATVATVDPANNDIFAGNCKITIRTAGAGGTMVARCSIATGASGTATSKVYNLASTSIDTTASKTIAIAIDRQGTATDSDSARLDMLNVIIY